MLRWLASSLVAGLCCLVSYADGQGSDPFTYQEARIAAGPVDLVGTLVAPAGEDAVPGIVILHGSGPETRTPYLADARMLASQGFAALVFDKRGTGASSGTLDDATLDDLRADGLAAVRWLRAHARTRPDQIGPFGVSQGGWIAPFIAADTSDVAFFVQITSAATPLATQEMWGVGNALARLGYTERAIRTAMKAHELLLSTRPLIRRGLVPLDDVWFERFDPWLDPVDAWSGVDVPALVVLADDDASVPTATTRAILEPVFEPIFEQHPIADHSRLVVFERATHALGGASRNDDGTYVATVSDWLDSVTTGGRPIVSKTASPAQPTGGTAPEAYGSLPTQPRWFGTVRLHLPFLGLLTLASLVILVASAAGPAGWTTPLRRTLLFVLALAHLALVSGLVVALAYLLNADAASSQPPVPLSLPTFLAAWASVAIAVVATIVVARGTPRTARPKQRALGALVVATAWTGVGVAGYWRLLEGPL